WPWILTGLAALAIFPELVNASPGAMEAAYPKMIGFLPRGIMGVVIASLFAAYMSTIESIVNLSGSYLLNDFYKPFVRKDATERHYVLVSRLLVILVSLLGAGFSYVLGSVKMGWALIMELSAGIGLVLLLRWYWWRVNAWSEIGALTASAAMAVYLKVDPDSPLLTGLTSGLDALGFKTDAWAAGIILIVIVTSIVWLVTTFLTPPDDRDKLLAFYRKVKPGGFWGPIARLHGHRYRASKHAFLGWALSVVVILFFLLGLGKLIFLGWRQGLLYLAIGTAAAFLLSKTLNQIDWEGS
ncbi:MAG: sodium:proline symporter, partial [Candidatus Aminicenantes bacterium]|nr:sodium:proline symporter [Candidatus Aminicenantes bacterium]